MQFLNIDSILVTFWTLKFDNFNDVKFEQDSNMLFILVTTSFENVGKSIDFKEEQNANILCIFFTFFISKFDKCKVCNFWHL